MKTRSELAKQAFEESCNPATGVKHGVKNGFPFWNTESQQFMYVPAFHFTGLKSVKKYRYDAVDENGATHSFEAGNCCERLTPIWAEIPEGVVKLTVTALNDDGSDYSLIGARTFFKSASFPAKTPKAVCSYAECARKAYDYAMKQDFIQHLLKYGKPDPHYDLNTYPTKIISSLVIAMLSYARICPERKDEAMQIAVNGAEYLLSITPRGDVPLADLPPTYHFDFCPDPDEYGIITPNYRNAIARKNTTMMIYPASAGVMYLRLGIALNDEKYINEAIKIGDYYTNTIEKNGTWYLVRSTITGEPIEENFIAPSNNVVPFLMELYDYTKNDAYNQTAAKAIDYTLNTQMNAYNWEGQFEDIPVSSNYTNLTHYGPNSVAEYYIQYHRDSPECMEIAKELLRFAEDQFVVWNRPNPWGYKWYSNWDGFGDNAPEWTTPCALEQYSWYVPIDASTSHFVHVFLNMYKAGCGEIYLAKAKALADQVTRVQHEDGKIPTHWMNTKGAEDNFWYNCMFYTCTVLEEISEYEDVIFED